MIYKDLKNDPELADIETPSFEPYDDDQDGTRMYVPDIDDADPNTHDHYVRAEVELSIGDQVMSGIVCGRKQQSDGTLRGQCTLTINIEPAMNNKQDSLCSHIQCQECCMHPPLSCLHTQCSEQECILENAACVEANVTASCSYGRSCTKINNANAITIDSDTSNNSSPINSRNAMIESNNAITHNVTNTNSHYMPKKAFNMSTNQGKPLQASKFMQPTTQL